MQQYSQDKTSTKLGTVNGITSQKSTHGIHSSLY